MLSESALYEIIVHCRNHCATINSNCSKQIATEESNSSVFSISAVAKLANMGLVLL